MAARKPTLADLLNSEANLSLPELLTVFWDERSQEMDDLPVSTEYGMSSEQALMLVMIAPRVQEPQRSPTCTNKANHEK